MLGAMPIGLSRLTFYCDTPARLAQFWAAALMKPVINGHGPHARPHLMFVEGNQPQALYFEQAPHGHVAGTGVALGVQATVGTVADEVTRLTGLGASFVAEGSGSDGLTRVTMADPAGNWFVVEPSEEEALDREFAGDPVEAGPGAPSEGGSVTVTLNVPERG
jgi:hypothetical protein